MRQGEFEYERRGGTIPYAPTVKNQTEQVRLSRQCVKVLERLKAGPATNRELSGISLQYCTPIRQLRLAGYKIPPPEQNHETGLSIYHLEEQGNG